MYNLDIRVPMIINIIICDLDYEKGHTSEKSIFTFLVIFIGKNTLIRIATTTNFYFHHSLHKSISMLNLKS